MPARHAESTESPENDRQTNDGGSDPTYIVVGCVLAVLAAVAAVVAVYVLKRSKGSVRVLLTDDVTLGQLKSNRFQNNE